MHPIVQRALDILAIGEERYWALLASEYHALEGPDLAEGAIGLATLATELQGSNHRREAEWILRVVESRFNELDVMAQRETGKRVAKLERIASQFADFADRRVVRDFAQPAGQNARKFLAELGRPISLR